jgi:hypothetical protein
VSADESLMDSGREIERLVGITARHEAHIVVIVYPQAHFDHIAGIAMARLAVTTMPTFEAVR